MSNEQPQPANLEAALLRGELDRSELMLRRLTQALGDLSFECFGVLGTCAPTVETYNRTFGVLEEARAYGVEDLVPVPDEDPARAERGYVRMVPSGVAVDTAPHPLLSAPTLYGRTGDVKDCNTLLVNRGELRAALGVRVDREGQQ